MTPGYLPTLVVEVEVNVKVDVLGNLKQLLQTIALMSCNSRIVDNNFVI